MQNLKRQAEKATPLTLSALMRTEKLNKAAYCKICTGFDNWEALLNFYHILNYDGTFETVPVSCHPIMHALCLSDQNSSLTVALPW